MAGRLKHIKGKNTAGKINLKHNNIQTAKGALCLDIRNGRP
jgi:hypothetical protein